MEKSGCLSVIAIIAALFILSKLFSFISAYFLEIVVAAIIIVVIVVLIFRKNTSKQRHQQYTRQSTPTNPLHAVIQNDMRFMNESVEIINDSKNIETVLSRYNILMGALTRLVEHEKNVTIGVVFDKELPSSALMRLQRDKAKIFNNAIDRAYADMLEKSKNLKTEAGRANRKIKFFELLETHKAEFPIETLAYIDKLKNQ